MSYPIFSSNRQRQINTYTDPNTLGMLLPPARNPVPDLAAQDNRPYAALQSQPRSMGICVPDPESKAIYFNALNRLSTFFPIR